MIVTHQTQVEVGLKRLLETDTIKVTIRLAIKPLVVDSRQFYHFCQLAKVIIIIMEIREDCSMRGQYLLKESRGSLGWSHVLILSFLMMQSVEKQNVFLANVILEDSH